MFFKILIDLVEIKFLNPATQNDSLGGQQAISADKIKVSGLGPDLVLFFDPT
jgi:hypothetical protein